MNALHRITALFHRNKSVSTRTNSKRQLRLESLEERQLLSVTPLGWFSEMENVTEISPSHPINENSGDDPFSYLPGSDEWNRQASQGTVLDDEVIREAFRGLEPESPNLMNTTSGCGGGGGPERGSAYHTGCGSAVWSACSGAPVPSYSLSVLQSPIREGVTGNSAYPLDALLHLTSSWPYADTNYIKIVNGGFIDTTGCDYGFSAVDITKFGGVTSWGQGIAASFTGGEITLTFRAEDDAIPHYDNDVEIDFYVGNYPDTSGCSGLYGCGWQTQVHGAKSGTVTVKDNDNWTVSASSVTNRDKALEPCGNTDIVGEFEIKRTDDTDTHYGINAVFALGGTADNKGLDYNLAPVYRSKDAQGNDVETLGTAFEPLQVTDKDGNLHWGGSVLIPIGEESVRLRVLPKSDSIFEQDETVTLEVIDATNGGIHYRTSTGAGVVTILQAPEFISDADENVDTNTVPFGINGDYWNLEKQYRKMESGVVVIDSLEVAANREIRYEITGGNDDALFKICPFTGEITFTSKPNAFEYSGVLQVKVYDVEYPELCDTASVSFAFGYLAKFGLFASPGDDPATIIYNVLHNLPYATGHSYFGLLLHPDFAREIEKLPNTQEIVDTLYNVGLHTTYNAFIYTVTILTDVQYWGYYGVAPGSPLTGMQGKFIIDTPIQGSATHFSLMYSVNDVVKLMDFIWETYKNPGTYLLLKKNCTTVAREAAEIAGMSIPCLSSVANYPCFAPNCLFDDIVAHSEICTFCH